MTEYEDWGSARIAQLEQQDLERYQRELESQRRIVQMRRPIQGFEMRVPDYYQRFCYWREEMISVGYPHDESVYIDYFIGDLQWHIRLRLRERRSSLSTLIDAYYEAHHHEVMIRLDEFIKDFSAANEIDEMARQTTIEIQRDDICDSVEEEFIVNNQQAAPYAEILEEKIAEPYAHKLFDAIPRPPPIELREEHGVIVSAGACDEHHLYDVLGVSKLPNSYKIISNDSAIKSVEDGNHFTEVLLPNPFVNDEETEPNEGNKGGRCVVFSLINGQPILGYSSVTTINVPNNGSAKAWVEESTLPIKTVSGKYVIEDDAYQVFGEITQAIRADLLDNEVINHSAKYIDFEKLLLFDPGGNRKFVLSFSREVVCLLFGKAQEMFVIAFKGIIPSLRHAKLFTHTWKMHNLTSSCSKVALNRFDLSTQFSTKQNIGYEDLGKWDHSMVEFTEATMEVMCGEIVLFMFDPGISFPFDEIFQSLQEAKLDEHVTYLHIYGNYIIFDPRNDRKHALRCVNDALTKARLYCAKAIGRTFSFKVWSLRYFVIFYCAGFLQDIFMSNLSFLFLGGHDEFGQQLVEGVVTLGSVLRAILLRIRIVTTILKLLEQSLISKGNGLIVWACEELGTAVTEPIIDSLIQPCLLEKRSDTLSCRYEALGAVCTLKCAFLKELGLVFLTVYQWFLHLLYVDDLFSMVLQVVISFNTLEDKDVLEWLGKDIILIDVMLLIMSSWYINPSHTHSLTNSSGISYMEVSLAWLAMLVDFMYLMPQKVITGISGPVSVICVSRSPMLLPLTLIRESLTATTVIDGGIHWCLCDELDVHYSRLGSSPFNLWSCATVMLQLFNTVICCSFGHIGGSNASYTVLGFEQNIYHINASSRKCCSILRIPYYLLMNDCIFDHDEYIFLERSVLVLGLHANFVEFKDSLHVNFSIRLEDDQDDICCIIFPWSDFIKTPFESICINVLMEWPSVEPYTTFCSELLKHGMDVNVFAIIYHSFEIHLAAAVKSMVFDRSEMEIQDCPSVVLEDFIWDPGLCSIFVYTLEHKDTRVDEVLKGVFTRYDVHSELGLDFQKVHGFNIISWACHWDCRKTLNFAENLNFLAAIDREYIRDNFVWSSGVCHYTPLRTRRLLRGRICHDMTFYYNLYIFPALCI